jgi:hypothetical protein
MPEEKPDEKKTFKELLISTLQAFPEHPSDTQIAEWKKIYPAVLSSGMGDDEIFIFRPITRKEYRDIQEESMKDPSIPFEDRVVEKRVLWASHPEVLQTKAGTIPALSEQILASSNFINPEMASRLVVKL